LCTSSPSNSGLVIWDYQSGQKKNAAKAAKDKAQKEEDARQLYAQLAAIHARLDEIEHKVSWRRRARAHTLVQLNTVL
jgi:hypothetical protein